MTTLDKLMALMIVCLIVIMVVGFGILQLEINSLNEQINPDTPDSSPFAVTGKQQLTTSVDGTYHVTSWNFTFLYNGEKAIQNVNFFLDNKDTPFKTVPEIAKNWYSEYIWTPENLKANRTITISWQGGTESYQFQP
jgi:hypothetical protein